MEISASGESNVEVDATQDSDQGNECRNGSGCDNFLAVNQLRTLSSEQATINSKANQNVEQGNRCNNGADCSNATGDINRLLGANDVLVPASGESTVEAKANQELEEQNGCEGLNTVCQNNGVGNTFLIDAAGASDVNSVSDQTIDTENDCKAGALCTTDLENSVNVVAQDRDVNSNVKQIGKANNNCEGKGVTCTADSTNTVNIAGGDDSGILQYGKTIHYSI